MLEMSKKRTKLERIKYIYLLKSSAHRLFLSNKMHRTCKFLLCYANFFLGIQLCVLERGSISNFTNI